MDHFLCQYFYVLQKTKKIYLLEVWFFCKRHHRISVSLALCLSMRRFRHPFTARKLSLDFILNGTHSHPESTRKTSSEHSLIAVSASVTRPLCCSLPLTILRLFCHATATSGVLLLTQCTLLWTETDTSLKILSVRYSKEMFSALYLIWVFRVNASQRSLNLVSTSSMVVLTWK